jgi:hypothetical protein
VDRGVAWRGDVVKGMVEEVDLVVDAECVPRTLWFESVNCGSTTHVPDCQFVWLNRPRTKILPEQMRSYSNE